MTGMGKNRQNNKVSYISALPLLLKPIGFLKGMTFPHFWWPG